ncbi:MAG TPA: hypothetical protein DCQ92_16460 [Verrucomicrobia subdivision 3 bacterium]|nr:hypothetical protein [Limisphaerales bacterium]
MRSSIHDRPAFIVGVTGLMEIHPDDIAAVRSAVQTIFDWIRYSPQAGEKGDQILGKGLGLPDSTPVVLLSSLAPGADQMVAATAVARNFCVRAPLPFPIQLYPEASTFRRGHKDSSGNPIVDATGLPVPTAEDLARQQQLADSLKPITSQNTFHVLLADDLNRTEPDLDRILQADLRDKHRRNLRYRAAGEYVSAYSDLLIAICDQAGENDAPIGNSNLSALEQSGARHILQVRRRGLTPGLLSVQSAISWADNGPIIRIYARRAPNYSSPPTTVPPTVDIKAGDIALWYPLDSRPHSFSPEAWNEKQMEVFREFVKRLAEMNDQLSACAPVDLQKSLNKLLPEFSNPYRPLATLEKVTNWCKKFLPSQGNDTVPNDIPPKQMCCSPKLERLALFRAQVTDRNRNFYDKKIKKLARSFFILALTAIFLVQLAEYWVPKVASGAPAPVWLNPLQIMAFLTAIIVISVAWWLNAGKKRSRLDDWQNDSRALGESLRVQFYWTASGTGQSVASNFLQRARGEASWLRSAVSSLAFPYEEDRRDFRNLSPDEQLDRLRRVKLGWVQEQLNFFERRVHEFQMRKGSLHFWANLLLAAGSGLVILNFFANPNRFEQTIEDACRWLGLWGFIAWGVLMLLGWLICHFVHLKAWQRHRSKVVQNFQPDPEESSHVAYER